jgi:hypothetical protein
MKLRGFSIRSILAVSAVLSLTFSAIRVSSTSDESLLNNLPHPQIEVPGRADVPVRC